MAIRERSAPGVPELVLQLTRAGFLALLWLFVLAALRVVLGTSNYPGGVSYWHGRAWARPGVKSTICFWCRRNTA